MEADVKAVREQVTDFVETLTTTAQEADDGTAAGAHLRVRIDDIANKPVSYTHLTLPTSG